MRICLATSILASVRISSSVIAEANPLGSAAVPAVAAPIVQVQPRAEDFNPHSAANQAELRKAFDVRRKTAEAGRGSGQETEHLPLLIS
jgi:hypothetical protein